jgi:hypothetical protein
MKGREEQTWATQKDGLTIRALDGEVLVYDPETARASCLNDFAAEVLALCDGKHSPAEIARDLSFKDVDERMVVIALADLQKAQLLRSAPPVAFGAFGRGSRRDMLRRIGVGTAIAVPVVTGIALPAAANGTTCSGLGQRCDNNTNCCDGLSCSQGICG